MLLIIEYKYEDYINIYTFNLSQLLTQSNCLMTWLSQPSQDGLMLMTKLEKQSKISFLVLCS